MVESSEKEKYKLPKSVSDHEAFVSDLDSLFDISSETWEQQIRDDRLRDEKAKLEDLAFLPDQQGPRLMILDKIDVAYAARESAKMLRLSAQSERRDKELKRKEATTTVKDRGSPEKDNSDIEDPEFKNKQRRKSTVTIELPTNVFANREFGLMADRAGMSDRILAGVTATLIKSSGTDINNFNLSYSTARRERIETRKNEYDKFKESFSPPRHAILGWDGKFVKQVMGSQSGNYLE